MPDTANQPGDKRWSMLVVTVGGSRDPVLHAIRTHRPTRVAFICSPDSRSIADHVLSTLEPEGIRPHPDFIELSRPEQLGPCYAEIRNRLEEILRSLRISPDEVLVDYTGGLKTMSAALVLAAVERFHHFTYVSGERRDRGGVGTVIPGSERVVLQPNPWEQLAIRDVERARDLWDHLAFEEAERVLRSAAERLRGPRRRFEAMATIAEALAARHRLDFRDAKVKLGPLQRDVPNLYDGEEERPEIRELLGFVKSSHELMERLSSHTPGSLLAEILDNVIRTARQHRWEDAAARLYRAMELQAQVWLEMASGGAIRNGRVKVDRLPAALQGRSYVRQEGNEVRFSLESALRAAADLGWEPAKRLADDIALGDRSRLRGATEKRNTSILAHGVQPIGEEGFRQMCELATELFGFRLDQESHPIPPFDVRWLVREGGIL